ncbi:unnamed protein product [Oncorhynchus mykiss]|uniref:Uncharacterized protein n=1 Tax=Oncorhynchus mykiss TaxID=8022 RepID=A0A060WDR5_ONCMY|nr:unnamed protein product [Oncorhynchus mykiss]
MMCMIYVLYVLHALLVVEGGKKAEAKATVVAAVDLARVRKPVHGERGHAEEETIDSDIKQQSMLSTTEQQFSTRTEAGQMQTTIQTLAPEQSIHVSQMQRTTTQVDTGLAPSPIPHFTVSKVMVPKPDHSYEVSIAGSAIATLQKELSSTSSHAAQKIIKPVKPPSHKVVVATRVTPEPTPPPFKDIADRYQTHFDTQSQQKQIGTSFSGGMEQIYEDWEQQVCNPGVFPDTSPHVLEPLLSSVLTVLLSCY